MIYVENNTGKLVCCWDLKDFKDKFGVEYKKVRDQLYTEFINNEMYSGSNYDIENINNTIDNLLNEEHIKNTWNENAYLCDVHWDILYVGDDDFDDIAEYLLIKYHNDLKLKIVKRLIAYEDDDSYPDKEDDELTNFVLEHFNKENWD